MRCFDVVRWRRAVMASTNLPLSAKVVALVLHEHMDWDGPEEGGSCWPGLRTIEAEAGMDRRTVIRALDILADAGAIERGCRRGCDKCRGGNGHVKSYTSHLPQRGDDAPVERGDDATASGGNGVLSGGNHAASGGNGASQRGDDVTGPIKDLPSDLSKDHGRNDSQGPCWRCSGLGMVEVIDTDHGGRPITSLAPCQGCAA